MKKRKAIALALSLLLCSGLITGCGEKNRGEGGADPVTNTQSTEAAGEAKDPFGKYEEPVKITSVLSFSPAGEEVPKDMTPEDNSFNDTALERMNIDVEWLWTAPADQYDQKLGVTLASGDLPDVLDLAKARDYKNLLDNEQLMSWNAALEYASDDFKEWLYRDPEILKKVTTEDGQIMALPQYWDTRREMNIMMIRQDWLDEVGMEIPATIEELEAVATAFVEKKGAEIGISLNKTVIPKDAASLSSLMNMFGSYPSQWIKQTDGTLQPGEISPNTKTALETLNRFYKNGLLSKEFLLYDFTKMREKVLAEELGILIGPWWTYDSCVGKEIAQNQDSKWVTTPIPVAEGVKGTLKETNSVEKYTVISKDCKNPEAIVKLYNLFVDFEMNYPPEAKPENGYVWNWTPVSFFDPFDIEMMHESFNKQIATGDFKTPPDTTGPNLNLWQYAEGYYKWKEEGGEYTKDNKWGKYLARIDKDGAWGTTRKLVEDGKFETNEYSGIASDTMAERQGTLDKLSEETYVKMVMGETPISEFEKYTKDWLALGGQDTIDEINAWYKENSK